MERQEVEIFSGFKTANPDKLLKRLMRLFSTIENATTVSGIDASQLKNVSAILHTTEFVMASIPDLKDRLQIIKNACLDRMFTEYNLHKVTNSWMIPILARNGRLL